ncbi:mterf [Cystoisospora suis]|uniref:Mterf n=1 Tax=Cystoisospora suis TaxID=483139 RepID=A0A2C6LEJ1_9APIC|nr:mterf [Cystoisospora suis]
MAPSPGISLCTSCSWSTDSVASSRRQRGSHHFGQTHCRSLCGLHFPRNLSVLCCASVRFYILFSTVTLPSAVSGIPRQLTHLKKTISGFSFSSSSFTPSFCRVSCSRLLPPEQHLGISRRPALQSFVRQRHWFAPVAYLPSFPYHSPLCYTPLHEAHQDPLLSRDVPYDLSLHFCIGSRIGVAPLGLYVSRRSSSWVSSSPCYSLPAGAPMFGEEVQLGSPKYRKRAVRSKRRKTPKFPYEPKDPVFYAPPRPPPDVPLPPGVPSPSRLLQGEENAELKTDGFHGKHDRAAELRADGCERQKESVSRKEEKASKTEGRVESAPRREEWHLKETTAGPTEVGSSGDPSSASELFDVDAVGGDYTLRVPPIDKRARRTLWIHRHLSRRSGTVSPVQEGVTDLLLSHDAPDDVLLNLSDSSGNDASSSDSSSCSSPYLRMLRSLAFPCLLNFSAEELKCLLSRYPAILLPRRAEACKDAVSWFTRERNWSPKAVRSLVLHVPMALAQGVPGVTVWFKEFEDLFNRGGKGIASPSPGTKEEAGGIQEGDPLEPPVGEVVEELHSRLAAQPDSDRSDTRASQDNRETEQSAGAANEQVAGRQSGNTLSILEQIAIDSPMVFNVRRPKAKITHFIKVWRQVRASRNEYRPAGWRARSGQDPFLSSGTSSSENHDISCGGGRQQDKGSADETSERVCAEEPKGENWRYFLDPASSELEWYRAQYECLEAFTGEGLSGIEQRGRAGLQADAVRLRRVMAQEETALQELFLKYPRLFTMRVEGNVRSKLLYLQNNMLKELEEVLAFPQFLSYSLRRRIIPRHIALVNVFLRREREKRKATSVLFDEGKLVAATRKAGRVRRHWDSRMQLKRKLTAQLRHRRQQLNPSVSMYDTEFWEQKDLLQEELLPIVDDRKGWRGIEPYQPLSMPALPPLREMFATSDETFRQLFKIPYQDFVGAKLDAERVKNPQTLF